MLFKINDLKSPYSLQEKKDIYKGLYVKIKNVYICIAYMRIIQVME